MRIGILGDIHSNLEALEAVVRAMRRTGVQHWVQVGDIVGYGPSPSACIDLVRELGCTVCMGNHDAAVLGLLDVDYFNPYARMAIEWTRHNLRTQDFEYLRTLSHVVVSEHYTLAHGTLHMPEQFGYVISPVEAKESMRRQHTLMGFVGHSHVPAIYIERAGLAPDELEVHYMPEMHASVVGCTKVLMNVGSVGQPRDEDPRAAFGLFDTESGAIAIERVEYDIDSVQRKIRAAGLPEVLARRLEFGV